MPENDQSFRDNLDLLIRLLRRMKDKSQLDGIPGVPKMFAANFDYFLQNYEQMKDHISGELLRQFGEPIKQMVVQMIEQLKEAMDGDIPDELLASPEETPVITGKKRTVEDIDELLKKPGLSEEEVDKLLDERQKAKNDQIK